jgi:hypothetical protein
LPSFIEDHNRRFAIEPADPEDAHRTAEGFHLEYIRCRREERTVTKNLMFQIDDACYALVDPYSRRNLAAGSRLELHLHPDRPMTVHHQGHELIAQPAGRLERNAPIVGAKDLNAHLDRRTPDPRYVRKQAANHPWKAYPAIPPTP